MCSFYRRPANHPAVVFGGALARWYGLAPCSATHLRWRCAMPGLPGAWASGQLLSNLSRQPPDSPAFGLILMSRSWFLNHAARITGYLAAATSRGYANSFRAEYSAQRSGAFTAALDRMAPFSAPLYPVHAWRLNEINNHPCATSDKAQPEGERAVEAATEPAPHLRDGCG